MKKNKRKCAVALEAEGIITDDNHPISVKRFNDIDVLTPGQILKIYQDKLRD